MTTVQHSLRSILSTTELKDQIGGYLRPFEICFLRGTSKEVNELFQSTTLQDLPKEELESLNRLSPKMVTQLRKLALKARIQASKITDLQITQFTGPQNTKEIITVLAERIKDLIGRNLTTEETQRLEQAMLSLKKDVIRSSTDIYTCQELAELVQFYSTCSGKSIMQKMPKFFMMFQAKFQPRILTETSRFMQSLLDPQLIPAELPHAQERADNVEPEADAMMQIADPAVPAFLTAESTVQRPEEEAIEDVAGRTNSCMRRAFNRVADCVTM